MSATDGGITDAQTFRFVKELLREMKKKRNSGTETEKKVVSELLDEAMRRASL